MKIIWLLLCFFTLLGPDNIHFAYAQSAGKVYDITPFMNSIAINGQLPTNLELDLSALFGGKTQGLYTFPNPWVIDLDALVGKALPGRGQNTIPVDLVSQGIPANFQLDLGKLFGGKILPTRLNVDLSKLFRETAPNQYQMDLSFSSFAKIISSNQNQPLSPQFIDFVESLSNGQLDLAPIFTASSSVTTNTVVTTDPLTLLLRLIDQFGTGYGGSDRDLLAILTAFLNSFKFKAGVNKQFLVQLDTAITALTLRLPLSLDDRQSLILGLIAEISGDASIGGRPKLAKFFIDIIKDLKLTGNDQDFFEILVHIVDSFTRIPSDNVNDLYYITTSVLRILRTLPKDKQISLTRLVLEIADRLRNFPNVDGRFLAFIPNLLVTLSQKSPDTYIKILPGVLNNIDNLARNFNVTPEQLEQNLINFVVTWTDKQISPELTKVLNQITNAVPSRDPAFKAVLDEIINYMAYLPPGGATSLAPVIIELLNQINRLPLGSLEELKSFILAIIDNFSRRPQSTYSVLLPIISDIVSKLERRPAEINRELAPLVIEISDTLSKYPSYIHYQLKPLIQAIINDVSKLPAGSIENVQDFIVRLIDNLASNKIGGNLLELIPPILSTIKELAGKGSGVPSSIAPLIFQFVQSLQNNATDFPLNYIPTIVDLIAHIKTKQPEKQAPLVNIAVQSTNALSKLPGATPENVFPVAKEIIDRLGFLTVDTYKDAMKAILEIIFKTYDKPSAEPKDALTDIVQYILTIGKPVVKAAAQLAIDKATSIGSLAEVIPALKLSLANPDKGQIPDVFSVPLNYDNLPSDAISQGFKNFLMALGNIFTVTNPGRPTQLKVSLPGAPNTFEPRKEYTIDVPYLLSGGKQGSQADILPFLNALGDFLAGGPGKGGLPFLRAIYGILKGPKEAPRFMLGLYNALNGGAANPLQSYPNFYGILDFLLQGGSSGGLDNFSPVVYVNLQPVSKKFDGQTQVVKVNVGGGYFGFPYANGAARDFSLDLDTFQSQSSPAYQIYKQFVAFITQAVTGTSIGFTKRVQYFLITVNSGTFGVNEQSFLIDANELIGQPGIGSTASIRGLLVALGQILGIPVPPPVSTFLVELYRDVLTYQKGGAPSELWRDIFKILTGLDAVGLNWSNFLNILYQILMTIDGIPALGLSPTITLDLDFRTTAGGSMGPVLTAYATVNGAPKVYQLDLNFIIFRTNKGAQSLQNAVLLDNEYTGFLKAIAYVQQSSGMIPNIFHINIRNPTPFQGERGPNQFTIDWEYFWTGGNSGKARDFERFLKALAYVTDGWNGFFDRFLNSVNFLKGLDRALAREWGSFLKKNSVVAVTNGVKSFLLDFYNHLTGSGPYFNVFYDTLLRFFQSLYVDVKPTGDGSSLGGGFFHETKTQLDIDGYGIGSGWGRRA